MQKGTNWEILNLNNRRLVRLKVHVILQKKSCTDVGNPKKKYFLSDQWRLFDISTKYVRPNWHPGTSFKWDTGALCGKINQSMSKYVDQG